MKEVLTVLQRQSLKEDIINEKETEKSPELLQKRVLKSLPMVKQAQTGKTKPILRKTEELTINEDGLLKVGKRALPVDTASFLYHMQPRKKQLPGPDYEQILHKMSLTLQLVANSAAKQMMKPITKRRVVAGKQKIPKQRVTKPRIQDDYQCGEDTKAEKGWE